MITNYGKDFKGKPLGRYTNFYGCSFVYKSKFYKQALPSKDKLGLFLECGTLKEVPYDKVRLYKLDEYQAKHLRKIVEDWI